MGAGSAVTENACVVEDEEISYIYTYMTNYNSTFLSIFLEYFIIHIRVMRI
jgi:hypothetical protein